MSKKYLMVSFDDPKTSKLADVLGNKTCKKIIDLLAEKEATKSEIANVLKVPLNTVEYNVNKLVEAGLIERSKNYFWSEKGKKIGIYKLSNKSIIISPKSKNYLKPVLPAALISVVITFLIWLFSSTSYTQTYAQRMAAEESIKALKGTAEMVETQAPSTIQSFLTSIPLGGWLLIGAIITLVVYLIILLISWKRLIKL
ncbi:MAG: ArsR/SmtB family transcription factor [Candidatus Pacearchaeota archaeon]